MIALKVLVTGVIHKAEDFYILMVEPSTVDACSRDRKIICKGRFFGIQGVVAGVPLELFGKWTLHPRFGKQFDFNGWGPWAGSEVGVENFLRHCLGILDETKICNLVDAFGKDTFRILSEEPKRLLEVKDFDEATIQSLSSAWIEAVTSSELSSLLADHDVSSEQMKTLFNAFGSEARKVISDNPYSLMEVDGFEFSKVDEVAESRGIPKNDPRRFEGAVLWVLREASQEGHLCVRRGDLAVNLRGSIKTEADTFGSADLSKDLMDATSRLESKGKVFIDPEVGVYLPNLFNFERRSAEYLVRFRTPLAIDVDLKEFLETYENMHQIKLSDAQQDAVNKLISNRVLVLTGGPGTGKTTVIKTFVELFKKAGVGFQLMAPTGIAAKRVAMVTGHEAATVHRTFRFNGEEWFYNEWNKYPVGAVIIDECCLPYKQFVDLSDGTRRYIGTIVNQKQDAEVLSFNSKTGLIEPKKIVGWFKYPLQNELYEFNLSRARTRHRRRSLRCTANHKVYTPSGKVIASKLRVGDLVLVRGRFLNSYQRSFALGSLLGDSCIGGNPSGRVLRFVHGQKQEAYLRFKAQLFQCSEPYLASGGYVPEKPVWQCSSPIIDDLDDLHDLVYPNKKRVTREWLDQIDEIGMAAWYMDDGSVSMPGKYGCVLLHTEGFSKSECKLICNWLQDRWSLQASVYSDGRAHYYLRLTRESSMRFWDLTYRWAIPSMGYKYPFHQCHQPDFTSTYQEVSPYPVRTAKRYIPRGNTRKFVYDIEVEGNHNYLTSGVLVSNSMVDQELFFRVVSSLEEGTILVLVGDDAQLPSVGPGSVLRDLIRCPTIPTVRLTQIFRQAQQSEIVVNSHRINRGEPILTGDENSDFRFVSLDDSKIADLIVAMAVKLKSRDANFQVLSPKYDGIVGVTNLNERLREALNPSGPGKMEVAFGKLRFRVGDRLMVVKNDYKLGVYNGDMGKLVEIKSDFLRVRVHGIGEDGLDASVDIPRNDVLQKLRLAYAITVHKCQGSEFDTIILPMVREHGRMLQRNLFYTAVTRAKKRVWVLGDRGAVQRAIDNDKVVSRNTGFGKAIMSAIGSGVVE